MSDHEKVHTDKHISFDDSKDDSDMSGESLQRGKKKRKMKKRNSSGNKESVEVRVKKKVTVLVSRSIIKAAKREGKSLA